MKNICVLGAGTWGCTLAALLAEAGEPVRIWDAFPGVIDQLAQTRVPAKLPHLLLPENILLERDLEAAVKDAQLLVLVVPSHAVRSLCERLAPLVQNNPRLFYVLCSKGIEQNSLLPLYNVMEEILGADIRERFCCLSGPTHAEEVSRRLPSSIVASAHAPATARKIQELFRRDYLRVYTQDDVLGAELGSAVKNVIAIATGVCDGLGFGDNTRAALITRGLAEMIRLGVAMGARAETFSGLTGMGDLIVTAMSHHSRNRNFGELIARGRGVEDAKQEIGMVVEGIRTADSVQALARRCGVSMPISTEVYRILYENVSPRDAVRDLMTRSPKPEIWGD